MEQNLISDADLLEDIRDEGLAIRSWRVEQLRRLGLSRMLAEAYAELVDWHEIAELIAKGCTPELALDIAR